MTPQETVPDLPVGVWESPAEAWVGSGLLQGWGTELAVHAWDLLKEVILIFITSTILSVQFSSVTQLCPTLCDPMNRSTPGLPVHHQFPEFTQTHVHQVGDVIQPSHPLSPPFPPAPNPSLHQVLFQ